MMLLLAHQENNSAESLFCFSLIAAKHELFQSLFSARPRSVERDSIVRKSGIRKGWDASIDMTVIKA